MSAPLSEIIRRVLGGGCQFVREHVRHARDSGGGYLVDVQDTGLLLFRHQTVLVYLGGREVAEVQGLPVTRRYRNMSSSWELVFSGGDMLRIRDADV